MLSLVRVEELNPSMNNYRLVLGRGYNSQVLGIRICIKSVCKAFHFCRLNKGDHLIEYQRNDICDSLSLFEIHLASRRVDNKGEFQLRIFEKCPQETVGNTKCLTFAGTIPALQLYVSIDAFDFNIIINDNSAKFSFVFLTISCFNAVVACSLISFTKESTNSFLRNAVFVLVAFAISCS